MAQWVNWLTGEGLQYHPVVRAAIAHHGFVAVHPYLDGNGRCARLLLSLQLLRDGYAPAFLLREWKLRYLEALHAADADEYRPLVNLIGQAVEAGLDFYLEACAAVPDEQYQPLTEECSHAPVAYRLIVQVRRLPTSGGRLVIGLPLMSSSSR